MPIYDVVQTTTVTLIHRIKADNKKDAIARMEHKDSSNGQIFLGIIEDDSESEFDVYEVNYYGINR